MTALREAFATFRRAPLLSMLGILTIAFSLFAFGLFGLVAVNIREALRYVESRVEIRAFIVDGTPAEATGTALADVRAFPEVDSARYISSDQALARARIELSEFQDVFEENVLPASLEIWLKDGYRTPATIENVAQRMRAYQFIDDVRFGEDWIDKLYQLRTIASFVGLGLGLAFAVVSVIIIGSTIRIMVLSRAREISIMRLVGATNGFIRLPFLLEGFLQGILGGLVALGLTWLTHLVIKRDLMHTVFFDPPVAAIGVLAGAALGFLASAFAVNRHLRKV